MPALEDDGEGAVTDEVLGVVLVIPDDLHAAAAVPVLPTLLGAAAHRPPPRRAGRLLYSLLSRLLSSGRRIGARSSSSSHRAEPRLIDKCAAGRGTTQRQRAREVEEMARQRRRASTRSPGSIHGRRLHGVHV